MPHFWLLVPSRDYNFWWYSHTNMWLCTRNVVDTESAVHCKQLHCKHVVVIRALTFSQTVNRPSRRGTLFTDIFTSDSSIVAARTSFSTGVRFEDIQTVKFQTVMFWVATPCLEGSGLLRNIWYHLHTARYYGPDGHSLNDFQVVLLCSVPKLLIIHCEVCLATGP